MLTPQEVASRAFTKATFGGYNMAMVDEFLDTLTADYTTLYNDNAILKNKLKVLSDTVEEYRATDGAMRKTLLAAQQMAESMVNDAEKQKAALVKDAEAQAQDRLDSLQAQFDTEEERLRQAREATAAFVQEVQRAQENINRTLSRLSEAAGGAPAPARAPAGGGGSFRITIPEAVEEPEEASAAAEPDPVPAPAAADPEATRRFDDLQFGKDYEIK